MKNNLRLFAFVVFAIFATNLLAQESTHPSNAGMSNQSKFATPDNTPKDPLENLKFRNLGPAAGGGRVTAVSGISGQPNVYYIGAAAGGVFRTLDGGLSWKPIFEKEAVASIGAIAIAPSNPNLVWVGTGEKNIRNDVSTGHGIYLTTDAGNSWKLMGLKDAGQIANIVIDPANANIVTVGVLGHAWGPNPDRGVFRTVDGGRNWEKVLYINDTTGVSSLVMDPTNPMVLYAGFWQMTRYPWMMISGGQSSGIYRSVDGGGSWKKLTEGLPEGPLGRIGLAVAPSNPHHLYALVEAKKGLLWDSLDMGEHWRAVSDVHALDARPFYFSELFVAPNNESRVYFLSFDIIVSNDGGKTAQIIGRGVHPDNHALWIDPKNPDRMILGNDGGVYVSSDTGASWRFLNNLPIEQFYQVAQDDSTPYNLCGGLQDNNGWCGPSNALNRAGISNNEWFTVVGGDGEYVVPAAGNTHTVYADSQDGYVQKVDISNGISRNLRPYLAGVGDMKPSELKYRFNWTSPIAASSTNADEVYLGGNVLFKSIDGGAHWNPISGDLTRNDHSKQESSGGPIELDLSGAESYDTILSVTLSPVDPKVIWVGTDDGLVQVTRDGGAHWANVTVNMPKLPEWGRIQQIEASPFDAGTGYVAIDFHEVENNHAYMFKTHDFGKTWTSIAQGIPEDQPARVVREDPNKKGFLVAGTETGLFYSTDDGAKWTAIKSNFPTVPIYDIKFVKKTHDLVVATHGRGIFVMDNIAPLEETTGDNAFHVYNIPAANHWHLWNKGGFGLGGFVAPNPPNGAIVDYYLPSEIKVTPEQRKKQESPVKIVVTDALGKMVRTFYGPSKMGFNRANWDLRYQGAKKLTFEPPSPLQPDTASMFYFDRNAGPLVLPGTYKVSVTANGKTETKSVDVALDPRFKNDSAAFQSQVKTALEVRNEVSALDESLNRINNLKKQLITMQELLSSENETGQDKSAYKPVIDQSKSLQKKLDTLESTVYNNEIQAGASDQLHFLSRLQENLRGMMFRVMSDYAQPPSQLQMDELSAIRKQLDVFLHDVNNLLANDVPAFNKVAAENGAGTLFVGTPIEIKPPADEAGVSN